MTGPRTPREQFLAEQFAAADVEAAAGHEADVQAGATFGPFAVADLALLRVFLAYSREWASGVCAHWGPDALAPLHWSLDEPDVLLCSSCAAARPPALSCAVCGMQSAPCWREVTLPASEPRQRAGAVRATPPVVLHLRLCDSCSESEE